MTSVPIIPQFSRWPKLPSRIQRFLLRIGHPPACRNPYQLAQWIDRLPRFVRDMLYDEVKPLSERLILGIGGINRGRGEGEHLFFALERQ